MPTILIVDDDKAVIDGVALVLREAGYTVLTAQDSAGARAAMAGADRPDACLFDVFMNGEDGLALAAELQGDDAPPVIIMSGGGPGRTLESVTARADALGAVTVLFKPFDDDELLDAVGRAVRGETD